MAKICPNCGTENPSAANFCMKCNTKLIDEQTQLSEEDRLRIELAEQNKVKALLDNENSRLRSEINDLIDKMTFLEEQDEQLKNANVDLSGAMKDKDASIKKMQSEITKLKKKKRHVGLIFFLIISLIAVGILSLTTGNLTGEIDRLRDELRDDDIRYSQQVTELKANLTEAKSKIDSLESNNSSRIESLISDIDNLRKENQKLKRRPKSFWVRRIDCYDHTFLLQLYYDNAPSESTWYHEGGSYDFD